MVVPRTESTPAASMRSPARAPLTPGGAKRPLEGGTMTARKPISKRTRFDIFKRDGFVCLYCGSHPPEVTLEVDHVVAIANGGTNHPANLATSCENCNRGKSAVPLSIIPSAVASTLKAESKRMREREEQLRGYYAIMEAVRARIEAEVWSVVREFDPNITEFSRGALRSIKNFLQKLGLPEVIDAMQIARDRMAAGDACFRYFCGICWNKIKARSEPDGRANG